MLPQNPTQAKWFKKYLPTFGVSIYWLYQLIKLALAPKKQTPTLESILIFSLAEAVFVYVVIELLLKLSQSSLIEKIKEATNKKSLGQGLLWAGIIFLIITFLVNPAAQILVQRFNVYFSAEQQSSLVLFQHPYAPLIWTVIAIFGGGFAEEIIRCFSLQFFENNFGKIGLYFCLILSSVLFGFGHIYQGPVGALTHLGSGLIYGFLFITKRNLVTNIVAHGMYDLIGVAVALSIYRY